MKKCIKYEGVKYFWEPKIGFYDLKGKKPHISLELELRAYMLDEQLKQDLKESSIPKLIKMAVNAKSEKDYYRAYKIALKASELNPNSARIASILSSILRAQHKPIKALLMTKTFRKMPNVALLTTRAAAFIDIGRYASAYKLIKRAWALSENQELSKIERDAISLVFMRLKKHLNNDIDETCFIGNNKSDAKIKNISKSEILKKYIDLNNRMHLLAEDEGNIYLPNIEPNGLVDYIFIAMEPSFNWASSKEDADLKVQHGFRNFLEGIEIMLLHFSIKHYLLKKGESYHITDISKGAMLVEEANHKREERYNKWFPLLKEEIELLKKPNTKIFSIGNSVYEYLQSKSIDSTKLIHYSNQASSHRGRAINGYEKEFNNLIKCFSKQEFLFISKEVLNDAKIPKDLNKAIFSKLINAIISNSRLELVFNYKLSFDKCINPS